MELLSAARMREIEGEAIASGAVSGLELMERAAQGLVDATPAQAGRAAVLCGPGNNGGDGYAAARLLADRGARVEVFEMTAAPATPDAVENRRRWVAGGGVARPLAEAAAAFRLDAPHGAPLSPDGPQLCIDALFGTGLTRPLRGEAAALAEALSSRIPGERPVMLACDIPSGLCADSGRALGGIAMPADLTVTFHAAKLGHHLDEGPERCGALIVHDIGLASPSPPDPQHVRLADGGSFPGAVFAKHRGGHKYEHGHALILSGGVGKGGAARLAARAALRVGAGLVTLGCPPAATLENAIHLNAVMLTRIGDAEALRERLEDPRINALALGMGLGATGEAGARTRALTLAALDARRAAVLDADALTVFREAPGALFDRLHPACVLTPHMGEFARLFPDLADRLREPPLEGPAFSRLDAAAAASRRAGCTVLLKGPDTVIATGPGSLRSVHSANYDRAVPWLATAGAGDVLAGIVAGLLARGFAPHMAAAEGAWLHAEAARAFGPGLIAEDIPDAIPQVLRAVGA